MKELIDQLFTIIAPQKLDRIGYILLFIAGGFVILRILILIITKATQKYVSEQTNMLIKKSIFYTGLVIMFITILNQLGISVTAFLGAAGIAGIAIGFAAQTSISNIISGLFLISEKSFEIGDILKIGDTVGIVRSIDLLAVRLRTFDNKLIRIPNESIIKRELANITKFPVRRIDIDISIAYKEDLELVKTVLKETARNNRYCLDDPEPLFYIKQFASSGVEILLGVWCIKEDYINLKNSIMIEIKKSLERDNIEIPYPHLSIQTGSGTAPFPLDIRPPVEKIDK